MRIPHRLPSAASAALVLAPLASAQDVQVMTIADEIAPIPGAAIVKSLGRAPAGPGGTNRGVVIDQLAGWPKTVPPGNATFAPSRGLVFADLDADGLPEIILSSTNGQIYAWDRLGNDMPGFPLSTIETPQYAPSVADLEGDGDFEIVQFTRGLTSGGRMYVIDHLGTVLPGYPKSIGNNNLAGSPTLYDLDDDGTLEILVPERAWPVGLLHVFEPDGTEWGGNWPVALDHVPTGSPGVADLDADGAPEVVYMSYDSIYAIEANGALMAGWPVTIGNGNHHSYASPALVDVDGDGDLEIFVGSHQGNSGYFAFHHDGTQVSGWPRSVGTWTYAAPAIIDLEGDGDLEVVGGREGTVSAPSNQVYVWHTDGTTQPGFPYSSSRGGYGGGSSGPLTIADIDGDGRKEIFADRSILFNGKGYLWGLDADGNLLPGFPLRPDGFTYFNGATIGDVDGDGDFELGVVSRLDLDVHVNIYDLDGTHDPVDAPWAAYHVSNRRGGDPEARPALHTQGAWVTGNTVEVNTLGEPGDLVVVAFALSLRSPVRVGSGWWYLGPFRRFAQLDVIPANGQHDLAIPLPALAGTSTYWQSAVVTAGGTEPTNLIHRLIR